MVNTKKLSEVSIIFIAFCLLVFLLQYFQSFLRPFVIAVILTFLFVPFTRLSKKRRVNIYLGTAVTVFSLIILVFGVGFIFSDSGVPSSANELGFTDKIVNLVNSDFNVFGNSFSVKSLVEPEKLKEMFAGTFGFIFNSTTTFLSELFLIVLFMMFLLPIHDGLVDKVTSGLKKSRQVKFRNVLNEVEQSIRDYLYVKSVVSLGTAGISFIFMLVFGVKFATVFALVIFALNFIPNVGSIVAVGLVLVSHFIDVGFSWTIIVLAVLLVLIQIIFGNLVEPKFAGEKLEISPIVILLALLFWGAIWGIGGMLFSVPLTVILKIFISNYYVK